MKIRRLTLTNFGIYAYKNVIDLKSDKPVVLIGGMNGRGKTTFLEAVLLALYGRRSFAVEESKLAFPKYLTNLVNKTDGTLTTRLELEFEMRSESENTVFTVIREWSLKTATPSLKTWVLKNDLSDQILSDNWDLFVEEMLPSAIAPFFFFDGEKIAELASTENDAHMKDSIKTLLGIHVIDQAIADTQRIVNNKKKLVKSDTFEKEIADYEKRLSEAESNIKASKEQSAVLRAKSIKIESKLNQAEKTFTAMGGNLAITRKELITKQGILLERLDRADTHTMEVAAGDLPLLLTLPLLKRALAVSSKEKEQRNIQAALEQLPTLFKEYTKGAKTDLKFDDFISYVKSTATNDSPIYNMTDNGHYHLSSLCSSLPTQQREEAVKALSERKKIQDELAEVENYLSLNVDETEAGKKHNEILQLTAELATIQEQLRVALVAEAADISTRDEIARSHKKLIESVVSNIEGADETKRIVKYSGLAVEVLQEYKVRLQKVKARNLALTMTDCFKRLASKKNLIHDIQIDEATLDFHYYNGNGMEVNHKSFSAGEKQLLVISMLWALAICSKKQLPVIVDTPLARMDSVHRKALITSYFPCASEQTILLSTDSEVNGRYYDMLKPFVGKEYTLMFDENSKRSAIETGYFGGEAK